MYPGLAPWAIIYHPVGAEDVGPRRLDPTYYEVLTGRLPFEGRNRMQVIYQHLNAAPVPPTDRAPGIPPLISDLCLWMLAKSPDERPQSADELRTAFAAVMGK